MWFSCGWGGRLPLRGAWCISYPSTYSLVFRFPARLKRLLTGWNSTYLLWHSINHIDAHGPMSTHARDHTIDKPLENNGSGFTDAEINGGGVVVPDEARANAV